MLLGQSKCPSDAPLQLIPISKAFDEIKTAHTQLGYAGYVKTFHHITEQFSGIPNEQVQ
jgi:hypothetical protein